MESFADALVATYLLGVALHLAAAMMSFPPDNWRRELGMAFAVALWPVPLLWAMVKLWRGQA